MCYRHACRGDDRETRRRRRRSGEAKRVSARRFCGDLFFAAASPVRAAACYNAGRLASYTVIGAVFGALGMAISYTMQTKSIAFTMIGILVALIGINMWGLLPGLRSIVPQQSSYCSVTNGACRRFAARPLIVGLLTGIMPCGPCTLCGCLQCPEEAPAGERS